MRRLITLGIAITSGAALLACALALDAHAQPQPELRWYKGNTHTHTINSDGDSSPDEVARWYKEHGYQFVVITDHNFLTSVDGLNALLGAEEKFLVISGEEVTDQFQTKVIHVNALGAASSVPPQGGASALETLQRNVSSIRAAKGVPHINHPNFLWSLSADELAQVRDNKLFEIFNGHPSANNLGGGGVPGLEEAWDQILSRGVLLYGLAVDDAHTFKASEYPDAARPGRGWIHVRAPRLATAELLDAIERGDFYSSTGVELSDYLATPDSIRITVRVREVAKYTIRFTGRDGRLLKEVPSGAARYDIDGTEGYVRAKVIESTGRYAWTQPVLVGR
jgi:predicted metal-dependent phosphoesterase TrpH